MLKEWKEAPFQTLVVFLLVKEVDIEGKEKTTLADLKKNSEPFFEHLTREHSSQLSQVLPKVPELFAANPEKTGLAEHVIHLKERQPIRQRSY